MTDRQLLCSHGLLSPSDSLEKPLQPLPASSSGKYRASLGGRQTLPGPVCSIADEQMSICWRRSSNRLATRVSSGGAVCKALTTSLASSSRRTDASSVPAHLRQLQLSLCPLLVTVWSLTRRGDKHAGTRSGEEGRTRETSGTKGESLTVVDTLTQAGTEVMQHRRCRQASAAGVTAADLHLTSKARLIATPSFASLDCGRRNWITDASTDSQSSSISSPFHRSPFCRD